jgi:hypothetical protein
MQTARAPESIVPMSARGLLLVVVTVVAIGVAGGSSAALAASGGAPLLLGEWHMDTIQSGEVPETPSTVNHTDGLQIYGAQQVAGRFGQAFSFNGADRDSLRAEGADFQPSQITVMAWVKASSSPGSYKAIVAKGGNNDCGVASYALYTAPNGGASFYIATSRTTTVSSASIAPAQIWNGQWHALVGTYDGSAVRLYLDGTLVGSATASGGAAIDYAVDQSALSVGDFEPCSGFSFTGAIDEVRVYNGALSDAEVAEVSSSTATTPPELTGSTPPPAASLTTLPSSTKGASPILSATGTTGATQLLYDINGDHKSDIALSPSMPYTQLILPKGGQTTVTLKAVGSLQQQTSTAATTIKLTSYSSLPANLGAAFPQIAVSSSSLSAFRAIPPGEILKALCAPTEVDFGIIGANGCLKPVTPDEIPASEQEVASSYGFFRDDLADEWPEVCASEQLTQAQCEQAWQALGVDDYLASGAIKLNGMTLTPNDGASIVIDPLAMHVFSSNATLKLGSFVIKQGSIDLDFMDVFPKSTSYSNPSYPGNLTYTGQTGTQLSFDASKDVPLIGGFPLNAGAELAFAADNGVRKSVATLHVELPPVFDVFGSGDQPSGAVSLAATNTSGLSLNTLNLSVPSASIGGIGLSNLLFTYDANGDPEQGVMCHDNYWSASADVYLGAGDDGSPGPAILMSPPPFKGIRFCQGEFSYLGADIDLGGAAPQIFPGVFLDGINFKLGLRPTVLIGGATLSAAQITQVQGDLLAVFASPGDTYKLTAGAAGEALQDLVGRTFSSTSFAVGGAVAIDVPGVGPLNIAHGGMVYEYPDYIAVGATVNTDLGIFTFQGSLGGQFIVSKRLFEVDANAHICIAGFDIACAGGLLVASEKGAVACVNVTVAGESLNPGVGVGSDGSLDVWIPDGCKPSHYWSDARKFPHVAGYAAAAPIEFTVATGETSKSVKLIGSGGAPHVKLTGPGGQSLTVAGDGAFAQGALQAISSSTYSGTWLGLKNARPGTYTITLLPDSAAIKSMSETRPGYDTNFTAKVTGTGSKLTLHYDARKPGGGQRVTFYEQGKNVMHLLVTSTGGKGTVRFTPTPGAGGTRAIVAQATVDGTPIRDQTLAHFRFAGTVKTGTPAKVTVQRKQGTLLVDWTAVAGAMSYGVLITMSDGAQRRYTVSPSHHSLSVKGYPLTQGGRVSVSARGALGDWGAARKSKSFKATKAAPSILLTKKSNRPTKKITTSN